MTTNKISKYYGESKVLQYIGTYKFAAWPKQSKVWKVLVMVDSIVVAGVLTCWALLHCVCDLKATQMIMQWVCIGP